MLISYKAVYYLIDRFYTRKSLNGIINECSAEFHEALDTALQIEDYVFLDVMQNKRDVLDRDFVIFLNYKNNLPTILPKDKDLTLEAFAILCVDCPNIPEAEFVETVVSQASGRLDIDAIEERFKRLVIKIKELNRLVDDKVQRNELCPCGSNKKFKHCHGSSSVPQIPLQ